MSDDAGLDESPEAIYERIRQRRQARQAVHAATSRAPAAPPATTAGETIAAAEVLDMTTAANAAAAAAAAAATAADDAARASTTAGPLRDDGPGRPLPGDPAGDDAADGPDDADDETFPRSRTLRFAMQHPLLSLAVGVPAVTLVARSATAGRLLRSAVRLGTHPTVWQVARLSAQAARHLTAGPPAPPRRRVGPPPDRG